MMYEVQYDVAAMIVTFSVAVHFFYKKTVNTRMTFVLTALIYLSLASSVFDLITVYTIEHTKEVPVWLNYALNEIYLLMFNAITPVYYMYVIYLNKKTSRMPLHDRLQILIPYAVDAGLILSTPFTHCVFYLDGQRAYRYGNGMAVLYSVSLLYIWASFVRTVQSAKLLHKGQRIISYCYTLACMVAVVMQMVTDRLLIVQFAIAIAVLLIYLSLENPEDYANKLVGAYNDHAFVEMLSMHMRKRRKFTVIGIRIHGLKYITETLGVTSWNQLLKQIAEFLQQTCGKKRVFYLSGSQFAVITASTASANAVIKKIQKRFLTPFQAEDAGISLSVPMCMLSYPDNVKNVDDVLDAIEYFNVAANIGASAGVVYANEETLKNVGRDFQIIQILRRAVAHKQFDVWYQPIYSVEKKRFTSAEALVRLSDEEYGVISPEEFIPLAEKNGMILEIGMYVFREVCSFIKTHRIWEYGIETIDVNLSVVQCMQEKLYETLLAIMDEYGLDYHYISLEITETAAIVSRETLEQNMHQLTSRGMRFFLDDYGTGFSNTATIIEYPFHTIKMDKTIVWSAMENTKAMHALKYSMAMIKAMQMNVIAEGVETQEQADLLETMGCDFFQGYLYSKPVNGADFLRTLGKSLVYA